MEWIIGVAAFLAGVLIVWLVEREKRTALTAINRNCEQALAESREQQQEMTRRLESLNDERTELLAQNHRLSERAQMQQDEAERERSRMEQLIERQRMAAADEKAELRDLYIRQLQQLKAQQEEQLQQQLQLLREQMNTASEKILQERSEQLGENNRRQMDAILGPLRENISQMRAAVEKSDREHTTSMERLDATIRSSMKTTMEVGERADRLAQALTQENKTQGNFGELRLRQLLQDMGLEEGVQFEEQVTLRNAAGQTILEEDGHRMQPDVILHFPDKRDVVIDSKMSFKAFIDYNAADTPEQRAEALQRHIASVRAHVSELSRKNYSHYIRNGHATLDFVLMYVYHEGALQLALANDPTLWKDAYDKRVIISGSQNLYALLRVLELTWKQVRQVENQQEIMRCANEIVNRTQLFYERFLKVEEQLEKTRRAFDEVKNSTAQGGNSIITTARQLMSYGASENPKRKAHLP
jgi:DNA recombination protein RmuC